MTPPTRGFSWALIFGDVMLLLGLALGYYQTQFEDSNRPPIGKFLCGLAVVAFWVVAIGAAVYWSNTY